ncbi:MAG: calcium-translocating P-type ATPase, PMCA-type [Candidatus Diapherotrites archaeon]|nr:calcium-translocating P-type ATPase, PMCA-type [Candidatus Diapherotrites archaeon]
MAKQEGLSQEEARRRLKVFGENKIEKRKKESPLDMLIAQFKSPIILLLIGAAIISIASNYHSQESYIDSIMIIVIVFAAAIAGFVQDYKAEKAVEALQKLAAPKAKVIRNGKRREVLATELVPGDIVLISGGDVIPADAEIIEGYLEVDESNLTGESKAVKKMPGDRVFSSTSVYMGEAKAKIYATGMKTELGKIAGKMQEVKERETPFQYHIRKFTKKIVVLALLIIVVVLFVGLGKFGPTEAFLIAVALAVAAVPEDLPAVIVTALSLGSRDMANKNALVRKLAVTESIGSVDVICTDKTGTLTKGQMQLTKLWLPKENKKANELAVECCYYCNDAKKITKNDKEKYIGDETDVALKMFSVGILKDKSFKRFEEIPFSSERERMSVACETKNGKLVFVKGAPEVVVKKSSKALIGGTVKDISSIKKQILDKNSEFTSKGFRVLALAYKPYKKPIESNLIFIGLAVLSDPPREEAGEAIKDCYSAGIRVIMITGDNPKTAKAVADEIGLKTEGVVTGNELDKMSREELSELLNKGVNIFARTTPFHKLTILEVLQKEGHIVAMTGDGVNDSLALKKADIGISMGIRGSQVAKEASDIILLDDNFATIRNAIKDGRRIFDNIRKFIDYLMTCNVAEVVVVTLATFFFPYILLYPVQILWINLITDGLPALALSIDPSRPDTMKRKPRKRGEGIINRKLLLLIGGIGIKKAIMILSIFLVTLPLGIDVARTSLFTGFILYEFVRIAVIRYNEKLDSLKDWFSNKVLVASLLGSLALQLFIIYTPVSKYFKVVPLGAYEWTALIVGTLTGFILGIIISEVIDRITKGEEY